MSPHLDMAPPVVGVGLEAAEAAAVVKMSCR